AVVALFALGFLAAGGAAALALVLPVWAALLVVGGILLGLTLLLAMLGIRSLRAGTPPVPEEAIQEARLTTDAAREWPLGRRTRSSASSRASGLGSATRSGRCARSRAVPPGSSRSPRSRPGPSAQSLAPRAAARMRSPSARASPFSGATE